MAIVACRSYMGRKHIQEQAILTADSSRLRTHAAELSSLEYASGKASVRLWRHPAHRSHRRYRIRDSEELVHTLCYKANYQAALRVHGRLAGIIAGVCDR